MTVETGVVEGNINRVSSEVEDLMTQARVTSIGSDQVLDEIQTKLEALKLRAETFMISLSDQDGSDTVAPLPESTPQNAVDQASSDDAPVATPNTLEEIVTSSADATELSQPKVNDNSKSIDDLLALTQSNNKLLQQLFTAIKQSDKEPEPAAVDAVDEREVLEFVQFISGSRSDFDAAKLFALLGSSGVDYSTVVRLIMVDLGERVMKPSKHLTMLFQLLSIDGRLNSDQQQVLKTLADYHFSRLADTKLPILPSPWDRGMSDLF